MEELLSIQLLTELGQWCYYLLCASTYSIGTTALDGSWESLSWLTELERDQPASRDVALSSTYAKCLLPSVNHNPEFLGSSSLIAMSLGGKTSPPTQLQHQHPPRRRSSNKTQACSVGQLDLQ